MIPAVTVNKRMAQNPSRKASLCQVHNALGHFQAAADDANKGEV